MVRGLIDNTINQVLDLQLQPLPPDEDRFYYMARDVADFINNLPGDHSVENEGILMAISAHGLQHSRRSNTDINIATTSSSRELQEANILLTSASEDESQESIDIDESDTDTSSNDLDMSWSEDDQKNESSDSLSYQSVNESPQNSGTESDLIENAVENHCDFIDEAILLAIQSKGLTTFGSDYG